MRPESLCPACLWIALALLGSGCRESRGAPAGDAPAERPPDVILIVVDTLRADRLGCYGYPRPTSPFIDQLAAEGARFEHHTSQFAWTVPSMVALLTGQYVPRSRLGIPAGLPTAAEAFSAAGYRTVGVSANLLIAADAGFDRGFDHFDSTPGRQPRTGGDDDDHSRDIGELLADLRAPLAAALKPAAGGERPPLFLYLHPMDPHDPYKAWPQLEAELPVADMAPPGAWHRGLLAAANEREVGTERTAGLWSIAQSRGRYDQEIRQLDDALRGWFEELEHLGVLDNAVICIAGDHGEGLWDHPTPRRAGGQRTATTLGFFYQGHGRTLFQEAVATPWILTGRGVPAGVAVAQHTENVDLLPTLFELAGLGDVGGDPGFELDGRSAVPLLRGQGGGWREFVYSAGVRDRASILEVATGLKLVLPRGALADKITGAPQLYDLGADPLERADRAAERPSDVARLREALLAWADEHALPGDDRAPSAEFLRHLVELGYTDLLDGALLGEDLPGGGSIEPPPEAAEQRP